MDLMPSISDSGGRSGVNLHGLKQRQANNYRLIVWTTIHGITTSMRRDDSKPTRVVVLITLLELTSSHSQHEQADISTSAVGIWRPP